MLMPTLCHELIHWPTSLHSLNITPDLTWRAHITRYKSRNLINQSLFSMQTVNFMKLIEFTFGVTNGVAVLQMIMNEIVRRKKLKRYFHLPRRRNCRWKKTQEDVHYNVKRFWEIAERRNITLIHQKTVLSTINLSVLGCNMSHGIRKPDPERMILKNMKSVYED